MPKRSIYLLLAAFFTSGAIGSTEIRPVERDGDKIIVSPLPTDSNQIKILTNYRTITSISQLLDSFTSRAVFVDLWATWCGPCAEEFKFSDALYDYLSKNNIDIIYVSFDKASDDALWRMKINENNLSGNHVRANKLLQDNITTLVWGAIDAYSIPNYLLFDKNKKLLNKHTLSPSSGSSLFKEIEQALR